MRTVVAVHIYGGRRRKFAKALVLFGKFGSFECLENGAEVIVRVAREASGRVGTRRKGVNLTCGPKFVLVVAGDHARAQWFALRARMGPPKSIFF